MEFGITGPAQSDNLFHFTGRVGDRPSDVPRPIQEMTPEERLDAIIGEPVLRAFPPFGTSAPCVCFSESPPEHLAFLINGGRVKPWGIVISRAQMVKAGGGSVAYVPDQVYEYFKNTGMGHWAVRVGPGSSWMHEREWRLPCLKVSGVRLMTLQAILIGNRTWRPSLIERSDPRSPGTRLMGFPPLWQASPIWVWDSSSKSVVPHPPGSLC
ncbi:hypothetical protein [Streptomyces sp. MMBL 11-1]|uniref:hypothetical protein n=1 Tax=Streptomyces sp. MMBL 11-1 TaxID=3026420 RepID=UPI00235EFEF6|nr:hypothetical protein [Streptomyces sp. MMBL 11-1]